MDLESRIVDLGGIYKRYASRLEKLHIFTGADFLYHIPHRYEDYSLISKIARVQQGETVTIQGTIQSIQSDRTKSFKTIQKATIADPSGSIEVTWFNQPFLINMMHPGDMVSLSGRVGRFIGKLTLETPQYEVMESGKPPIHTGRLVPIYPETYGISSKWLRKQTYQILTEHHNDMEDFLPDQIRTSHHFMSLSQALFAIHFPNSLEQAQHARERLSFDELFLLQLGAMQRKHDWDKTLTGSAFVVEKFQKQIQDFWSSLPFTLTHSQQKAINDIFADLSHDKPMNRLLEGDVGSGKTVVGTIAMYLAHLNGFQSILMAPTEILANQHYATISRLLEPLGVKVDLVTGSKKPKGLNNELRITNNEKKGKSNQNSKFIIHNSDILVGTHALLSQKVQLDRLGLVIIDEQQRFGVEQRALIKQKGNNPHLLTMTATPIPRTVALTLYGDLDLSTLDEMPKGRKKIKTWLVPDTKRESGYEWIRKEIQENKSQAFIICPFIEESESMSTVKAAKVEFEKLQTDVFPDLKLGLLHGKQKAKEKDEILAQFGKKEIDILVATPVVEVGIDFPNATIIVIEAAERFGLAQLHQLRGRVGRGEKQSYCLLFSDSPSEHTRNRLKAMETMDIGAELAEFDLRMRGPGDIYGTMQHGMKKLKVASFSDFPMIEKARNEAKAIFSTLSDYPLLAEKLAIDDTSTISPD